jgi:trehalose 6-phosphate synthase/phosphatase
MYFCVHAYTFSFAHIPGFLLLKICVSFVHTFLSLQFQFAGAAQSLGAGAILVNPWNITEVADSINHALTMTSDEREKRHRHNYAHVTTHTAQDWAETFVW